MDFKKVQNVAKSYTFRQHVPPGGSGYIDAMVNDHGYVDYIRVRFAAGENGTLKIRPVMIICPDITIDLLKYAGDDHWIIGDNETIESSIRFETENYATLRVYYENTATEENTVDSLVDVNIGVTYFATVEVEGIIGPRSRGWLNNGR